MSHAPLKPPRPAPAHGSSTPDAPTILAMLHQIAAIEADGRSDVERLPLRLSPSRAADFKTCPKMFYYRTITKLSSPPTEATARGTLTHTVCERTFDHPAGERTPELTKTYIRPAWEELVNPLLDPATHAPGSREHARAIQNAADYRALAPAGSVTEEAILTFVAQMVDNWYVMEKVNHFDPTAVTLPDGSVIDGREVHVSAELQGMVLHGYIDRLDSWVASPNRVSYAVSDYKTGRVPGAGKSYSPEVMERIAWDSFFQLRVYALLMWELHQVPVSHLRLVHVATGDRETGIKTLRVTGPVMDRTRAEIKAVWSSITRSAQTQTWQPRTGPLCAWCYFAPICPAYADPEQLAAAPPGPTLTA